MNSKQNQRIQQIGESTLLVGADIAKHNHVARAQDFRGIELGKALTFGNSAEGLQRLVSWIESLMQKHDKRQVLFGIEPTVCVAF